jgi:hypothetical protein
VRRGVDAGDMTASEDDVHGEQGHQSGVDGQEVQPLGGEAATRGSEICLGGVRRLCLQPI